MKKSKFITYDNQLVSNLIKDSKRNNDEIYFLVDKRVVENI